MKITIKDHNVFQQGEADIREIEYHFMVEEDSQKAWEGSASVVVSGSLLIDWLSHFRTKYKMQGFDEEFAKFGLKVIEKEIWQFALDKKEPITPIKFTYYTGNAPSLDFDHHQISAIEGYIIEG